MKSILITAFEPFGGETLNPSLETVKLLPAEIDGVSIEVLSIPVEFKTCSKPIIEHLNANEVCAVLSIGQAGGRNAITLERIAINVDDATIADNAGYMPCDKPIEVDGAAAYFSTLPIKRMVSAINAMGVNSAISNSAGTYVCNHLMYSVLSHCEKKNLSISCGFMHLPYCDEQVLDRPNIPSMSMEMLYKGTIAAIRAIIETIV